MRAPERMAVRRWGVRIVMGALCTGLISAASAAPVVEGVAGVVRPGPGNTGVPAGVILTPTDGMTITVPDMVLDSLDVSGPIVVQAPGVVIKNSRISGTAFWGVKVDWGDVTIVDTEITGFANAIAGDNWTARRVDIHSTYQDGVKLGSHSTLEDSWIHDLTPEPGAHSDGAQAEEGVENVVVRNNVIDVYNETTGDLGTSAIMIKPDFGRSTSGPVVIEGNYLNGGNCTLFSVPGNSGNTIGVVEVRDNVFGGDRRYDSCYGHIHMGVLDSGNTAEHDGAPVEL